jgi:hypothetical protein
MSKKTPEKPQGTMIAYRLDAEQAKRFDEWAPSLGLPSALALSRSEMARYHLLAAMEAAAKPGAKGRV